MTVSGYYIQDYLDIDDKQYSAAKNLYYAAKYDSALQIYLKMSNLEYSYKLNYEIGRCYYKLKEFAEAEKYFINSVSIREERNPSHVFIGNLLFRKGEVSKAIESWVKAYGVNPDDESVCLNLATSYFTKGMRFQSIYYYEKYLKYAKDKTNHSYNEIKTGIEEFSAAAKNLYEKSQEFILKQDTGNAIQALKEALAIYPLNFDSNILLGKLYFTRKEYEKSLSCYLQAYCIDPKSLDVIQSLIAVYKEIGNAYMQYCCTKRLLPLVLNSKAGYIEVMQSIKDLEGKLDKNSAEECKKSGDFYFASNNYEMALFEYENSVIITPSYVSILGDTIHNLKNSINAEAKIIRACFDKGGALYTTGDFRESNKYFSKIMALSAKNSSDYNFARSRIVNV